MVFLSSIVIFFDFSRFYFEKLRTFCVDVIRRRIQIQTLQKAVNMNLETLRDLIQNGESERVEFKRTTGQRTEAVRSVCSMLNGQGGVVIFGVTDKGEMIGQQVSARTLENISAELRRIEPPAFPDIETIDMGKDRSVILLRVLLQMGIRHLPGKNRQVLYM